MIVGRKGLQMDKSKVKAILNWPEPRSIKEVQAFIGLANFYKRFMNGFLKVARPLTTLIKKTYEKFTFEEVVRRAF